MDDHKPIWDKIERQDSEIRDLVAWRQTAEYRIGQTEQRFDQLIKDNARAFGELSQGMKALAKELSEVHSELMRERGRLDAIKESKTEATDYKRWIWPVIISAIALLYTMGVIGGAG